MATSATYLMIIGAFLALCGFGVWELWLWWRQTPRKIRWWAALGIVFLFGLAVLSTHDTVLRGGYENDHDFRFLGADFLDYKNGLGILFSQKEVSPLAVFALVDRVSDFSLDAILMNQKSLWFLSALLMFAALRRFGLGAGAASLAAGILFSSFLSILNTYSFSTTNINVFYLMVSIYALAGFSSGPRGPRTFLYLVWFLSAAFLVFTARWEFFPVLLWGFGLSLFFGGAHAIRILWRRAGWVRAALPAAGVFFVSACLLWSIQLSQVTHPVGPGLGGMSLLKDMSANVAFQLGEQNLGALSGIPAAWFPALGAVAMLGAVLCMTRRRKRRRPFLLLGGLAIGWGVYFSAIYSPITEYPLQCIRHHLYFFLPFAFLSGLLADGTMASWSSRHSKPARGAVVSLLLAAYCLVSLRQVAALQPQLRTNDLEWQFLHSAWRQWPKRCGAVDSTAESRQGILRKYFSARPEQEAEGRCVLAYRSPRSQTFRFVKSSWKEPEPIYGPPFLEVLFSHRFYTIWQYPLRGPLAEIEIRRPDIVRAGFYHVTQEGQRVLRAYFYEWDGLSHMSHEGYDRAIEAFSRALEFASSDRELQARLLNDRGLARYSRGDLNGALGDFEEALRADARRSEPYLGIAAIRRKQGQAEKALGPVKK